VGAPAVNPGVLNALRAAMAARGQQQGGAGVGGQNPNQLAQQVNSQMANLRKVSPQQIQNVIKQMKTVVARLIVQTEAEIPGVARYMAPMLRALDGALKEAGTAAQTQNAATPIGNTAAGSPGATPPGAAPDAGQGLRGQGLP
jgi:hypothetical protein